MITDRSDQDEGRDRPLRGLPRTAGPLQPLSVAELPNPLYDALRPRIERLGYLGAFFGFAGRQPEALLAFVQFTGALTEVMPPDLTQLVALTVSSELGTSYEQVQHERLAARLGFEAPWVAAATGRGHGDVLDDRQRAARTLVLGMLANGGHGVREQLATAVALVGQEQAVGLLLLAARYIGHAHVANALELTSPVNPAS